MLIYGQIQSFDLTNVLVFVHFGNKTWLVVDSLTNQCSTPAYTTIVERTIDIPFDLSLDYPEMDIVMRTLKKGFKITNKTSLDAEIDIAVRKRC